jgi:AcrR family transcriptional regulator
MPSLHSTEPVVQNNTRRLVARQDATVRLVIFSENMTPRREPDPTRRSSRAQAAILEATRELIGEIGWDKMSIEGIAAAAGVGKQTIYRWWPSKAALVLDMWSPEVQQQLHFPNTGNLAADLKAQIKSVIDLSNDPTFGPSFRALVAESQLDTALSNQLLERIFRPRIEAAKERLRAAQHDGQLAPDIDLDLAIDLFYGGFYHRYLLRVAPLTHEHADAVVDAVLGGIGGRAPMAVSSAG